MVPYGTRSLTFLDGKLYKEWQSDFCVFFGPFFGPEILYFGLGILYFGPGIVLSLMESFIRNNRGIFCPFFGPFFVIFSIFWQLFGIFWYVFKYVLCFVYIFCIFIFFGNFWFSLAASNLLGEPSGAAGGTLGGKLRSLAFKLLYKNPLDKH